MVDFEKLLPGGDLRSIGKSNSLIQKIKNQDDFDNLFKFLFHKDRIVVMRAADTIEKITVSEPQFLDKHKKKIFELCFLAVNKELMWHLAQLLTRLEVNAKESIRAQNVLSSWAKNELNSRIVRVNSLQALFELTQKHKYSQREFSLLLSQLEKENIPSINARIKKIKKQL